MSVNHADRGIPKSNGAGTERQSELGVGFVFGCVAGGVLGLISGLAQYNALYTGSVQFVLPTIMTLAGGVIGSVVCGALGLLGDSLMSRWKRSRAAFVRDREVVHTGGGNILARTGSASGRPAA